MKTLKILGCVLFGLAMCYYINSCTKMDDYKKFAKGGPIRYTARVDSIIVRPGYKRIELSMLLEHDPSIKKIKVYWNNSTDSLLFMRKPEQDSINIIINNLQERSYSFTVYTYDSQDNSSVAYHTFGAAYGDAFKDVIANRSYSSFMQSPQGGSVVFEWNDPYKDAIGTVLKYIDENGNQREKMIKPSDMKTELTGYKPETKLRFKSLYLPDSLAIDTLSVDYSSVTLPTFERELNKNKFKDFHLPNDAEDCCGWVIQHLWDGDYSSGYAAKSPVIPNLWFTIDLGDTVRLSRFKTWQAPDRLYDLQSIRKFDVYGSLHSDSTGSWSNWVKLMTCVSTKPSGLPKGQVTEEDITYAESGEEFVFPDNIPEVRYIRIKPIETWGESDWATMGEITFWTHDH